MTKAPGEPIGPDGPTTPATTMIRIKIKHRIDAHCTPGERPTDTDSNT